MVWYCLEQPWTWMRAVGVGVAIPSFLLWATARIQLGKSFSLRPMATELVTRGLYSKIRNPVYVFGGLFGAGFVLAFGNVLLLLLFIALVPLQMIRARQEARVLEEKFGAEFREYRRKTWF
jgi:protein-S-isoprenylcysteine O-methyltransferase Ste14